MGREVTGMQVVDEKPNGVLPASYGSSNDNVCISPKMAAAKAQAKDHEVKECTKGNSFVEKSHEKKDVLSAKTTNCNTDLPEEEIENSEVVKMGDSIKFSSPAGKEHTGHFVTHPTDLVTEKHESHTQMVDTEADPTGLNLSPSTNNMHSPISSKNSQVIDGPCCYAITRWCWSMNHFNS